MDRITCDTDIDECVKNTHNCSGQNEMCNNTAGGFDCVCVDGYQRSASGICIEMTKVNLTMTLAVNVNYTQHELDNTSSPAFTDLSYEIIKELWKNLKNVEHKIKKIVIISIRLGSVTFEAVVIIDDVSDEEAVNQVAPALQTLAQTNFTIYNETTEVSYYIVNVIEGPNERCNSTGGTIECVCEVGYQYNASRVCVACANGNFGKNCSSTCTCITNNTVNCSNVDGACTCRSGWTGGNCSDDINECTTHSSSPCVANSTCYNTNGSYLCVCDTGYLTHADGNCTECMNSTYGTNCSRQCQCNVTNTVSPCHHVTGNCTCKQGWTGSTCNDDLDECSSNTHNCSGPHQTCINTVGGFTCVCADGVILLQCIHRVRGLCSGSIREKLFLPLHLRHQQHCQLQQR
ncbi:platelet endothelial aggregation receptor 1-like [Pomacea canaliculata]|uniref:platelet endothelial aggregation receptor 1-like n=1 Tax=Pomacea canaliculata TaxID=400727 RepID=UPI000D726705|nr:platelet endothelial aggregation receptor 1-like [Pomacea canaliculata]